MRKARSNALRRELLDPKIAEHRGRIVKTTGDGLLVEFASVVPYRSPEHRELFLSGLRLAAGET